MQRAVGMPGRQGRTVTVPSFRAHGFHALSDPQVLLGELEEEVERRLRPLVERIRGELPIDASRYLLFGASASVSGWQAYEALIAAAAPEPPAVAVKPEDLFALMYTSGTTGRPKGAMRSHEGNALIALATALEFGLGRDDTGLLVMPLCHANSLYFGVTFAMLGATIVVDDRRSFDPEALLAKLAHEHVVRFRDVQCQEEPWYIVMDLAEGRPLEELIDRPLSVDRVADLVGEHAVAGRGRHAEP